MSILPATRRRFRAGWSTHARPRSVCFATVLIFKWEVPHLFSNGGGCFIFHSIFDHRPMVGRQCSGGRRPLRVRVLRRPARYGNRCSCVRYCTRSSRLGHACKPLTSDESVRAIGHALINQRPLIRHESHGRPCFHPVGVDRTVARGHVGAGGGQLC